ncbi:hypothetical protein D047_2936, partial [Vibrio parahaemolyticus VPTS-2010_2]
SYLRVLNQIKCRIKQTRALNKFDF